MTARGIALFLLGLSVVLATGLYFSLERVNQMEPPAHVQFRPVRLATNTIKTNVVVRRQYFTWQEVESRDYPTYIANLRSIDCPEATIRDIIIADVNQLYAQKKSTEIVTADQQWWRSEPDMEITHAASEKMAVLEAERRALLTQLLGPEWETASNFNLMPPIGITLNGPILGNLSADAKKAVQDIHMRSLQRTQDYLQEQEKAGKPADSGELARLRQQTRAELAQVLDPTQLEEYLLRYSQNASNLRAELRSFELSPDEFRKVFRARDAIDQEIQKYGGSDAASAKRRQELEKQQDIAMQQALSPERYRMFRLNQDPVFQQAQATAQQYGAPAEVVLPLYQVNRASDQERQRIRNNRSLSLEQQTDALQAVQSAQQNSLRQLLGEQAYQRYLQNLEK